MVKTLHPAFISNMTKLLGAEAADFFAALSEPPTRGVRLHRWNRTHTSGEPPRSIREEFEAEVPWMNNAYYIDLNSKIGKTAYHETGAFYIQDPSAMAVAAAANIQLNERVLDLCAAPGGKATALGQALQGTGLLVANEIHPTRVVTLAENLERLGVPSVVTQASAEELAANWSHQFDVVVVDAPCSGEGMFRKDPESVVQWTPNAPMECSHRQQDILRHAVRLLKPGGRLIYSTCTFNPLENEGIVAFMEDELGGCIEELPAWTGWSPGCPEWVDGRPSLLRTRRLWPHKSRGEGHFVTRLVFDGPTMGGENRSKKRDRAKYEPAGADWRPFAHELIGAKTSTLPAILEDVIRHRDLIFSNHVGLLPPSSGLRILRPGTPLAMTRKDRFEPQHALAMLGDLVPFSSRVHLTETESLAYLRGEALSRSLRGYVHVELDGLPLGFAKGVGNRANNLYPKGLRRTLQPFTSK